MESIERPPLEKDMTMLRLVNQPRTATDLCSAPSSCLGRNNAPLSAHPTLTNVQSDGTLVLAGGITLIFNKAIVYLPKPETV